MSVSQEVANLLYSDGAVTDPVGVLQQIRMIHTLKRIVSLVSEDAREQGYERAAIMLAGMKDSLDQVNETLAAARQITKAIRPIEP